MTPEERLLREQVLAMDDAALVAAVAERVMEYNLKAWQAERCTGGVCWGLGVGTEYFTPLTNWNHTFLVVEAMRAKGWDWALEYETGFKYLATFTRPEREDNRFAEVTLATDARLAILQAALVAMK